MGESVEGSRRTLPVLAFGFKSSKQFADGLHPCSGGDFVVWRFSQL